MFAFSWAMAMPMMAVMTTPQREEVDDNLDDDALNVEQSPADSDCDFEPMEGGRSLLTLTRADKIKVLEFIDPTNFSCCRLSQLSDATVMMLAYIVSPTMSMKTVASLGLSTMAGFKRAMRASSVDNGILEHLVKSDLQNLPELAASVGWVPSMAETPFHPEVKRVPRKPRPRPSRETEVPRRRRLRVKTRIQLA